MRGTRSIISGGVVLFIPVILALFYNNCSKGFSTLDQASKSESLTSTGVSPTATVSPTSSPTPTGTPPVAAEYKLIDMRSAGSNAADCMTNSNYDACIFYKNPWVQSYTATNSGLSTYLVRGTNLSSVQTFGVKLKNRTNTTATNVLQSASLIFKATNITQSGSSINMANVTTGMTAQPKAAYAGDSNYLTGLTHLYFWSQQMEEQLLQRTGIYYGSGKALRVNVAAGDASAVSSLNNNAFWTPNLTAPGPTANDMVVIGTVTKNRPAGKFYEAALDAEVVLHELGHANFAYARGYPSSDVSQDNYSYSICAKKDSSGNCTAAGTLCGSETSSSVDPTLGCLDAINEGLADFFYVMMFPQYPTIWETRENTLAGIVYRDLRQATNKKVADFIPGNTCDVSKTTAQVPGSTSCTNSDGLSGIVRPLSEIHYLGAAYASILYEIYTNASTQKRAFEKTFLMQIQQLGPSSRFKEARDLLLGIDQAQFGGINSAIINAAFAAKGVQ